MTSLVSWTVAGNHLVGFGDLLLPNGVYKSGLFEIPFADPSTYNIISSMTLADPRRVFYWGGFPYLASIGNEAYFLEMGPVPTVYKFKPGEDDKHMTLVYKLPNDLRHPGLPRASDSLSKFFHATEKAVMPIGLYSTDNFLFILARRPQGSSTIWELLKIDPKQGRLVSRRPLPIHPKHLLVIPGEQFWGFLAKGDISESGHQIRQETGSLMLVPRQILESDMPFCSAPEFIAKASVHISPGAH